MNFRSKDRFINLQGVICMKIHLKKITLPDFGTEEKLPILPTGIFENRCRYVYDQAQCDWIVIYGDREHFSNLYFLTGFDPRFEEALLLIGPHEKKYLIVGNEGVDYAKKTNRIEAEIVLYQSFSLLGQDRNLSPRLDNILIDLGIEKNHRIGMCGWKYFEEEEQIPRSSNIFVPSPIIDSFQYLVNNPIVDISWILMHPTKGLRSYNEVEQLAFLEWGASRASDAVNRIIRGVKVGMTEYEAVSLMNYSGETLSAHVMFSAGRDKIIGLSSPSDKPIAKGDGVTTAVGYWGGLSCRAGILDKQNENHSIFLNNLAKPYFESIVKWYETASIGVSGRELWNEVVSVLQKAGLKPALNVGHQTSIDEWMHSLVSPDSDEKIKSGMAFQCDIIPTPLPDGIALNCEDSVFFADESMRKEIKGKFPSLWSRIERRQQFIREKIGINISDDLLPLSNNCGYYSPFWLEPDRVLVVER